MPDLKTELTTKVLPVINNLDNVRFDDSEDPAPPPNVVASENITRVIFECLRRHGTCTAMFIRDTTGVPNSGVHSRLTGLIKRGLVERTTNAFGDMAYRAVSQEFKSMGYDERIKRMNESRKAKKAEPKAAPAPAPKATPVEKVFYTPPVDQLDDFVSSLTVADAQRLRAKLNAMFN